MKSNETSSTNFTSYIRERYGNLENAELLITLYNDFLKRDGWTTHEYPYGFFIAKQEGDALVINDIYVTKRARLKGLSKALFYDIKQLARSLKSVVIIGFSEHAGQNQHLGKAAMEAVGFIPTYNTDISQVYMRGTN